MRASHVVLVAGIIGAAILSRQGDARATLLPRDDVRGPAPAWRNDTWLNSSSPITLESLKGRVVLLNFWTYACYNCTNTVPALTALDAKYRSRGLSLLGIHTPEYPPHGGEHDTINVRKALTRQQITYPNAMDNDRATWRLYGIRYWPSLVLIDKQGRIRHEGYGEVHVGDRWYADWERRIEQLLAE
jgi:thiol-disulfide isomerase/thioredoxin